MIRLANLAESDNGHPQPSPDATEPIAWGRVLGLAIMVTALAVSFRLPFCSESFWLDELHSAWVVWDEFSAVTGRAAWGNQTPVYYWGLWCWRQLAGDSEVALRLSSVALSSLACGVVAAGVARHSRSLFGGAVGGVMLAVEANAIFFGTELRVFAAVMLCAAIVCWGWISHRRSGHPGAALVTLVAVAIAGLLQPTSLGVLIWPPLLIFAPQLVGRLAPQTATTRSRKPMPSRNLALGRWSSLVSRYPILGSLRIWVGLAGALFGGWLFWWLTGEVLLTAWRHRQQWESVGSAHSPWQIWTIWRWNLMLIFPAALALGARFADRGSCTDDRWWDQPTWLPPALLVIATTLLFWMLSASGIVTLFHRRYLIAALPLLAWTGGAAIGQFSRQITKLWATTFNTSAPDDSTAASDRSLTGQLRRWGLLDPPVMLIAVFLIGQVSSRWLTGAVPPTARLRGEDWRAAVAHVRAESKPGSTIWLAPGLIEAERLLASENPAAIEYLAYPLAGPYRLSPVSVITLGGPRDRVVDSLSSAQPVFAIIRASHGLAERWSRVVLADGPPQAGQTFTLKRFGGVQVIEFHK